MTLREAIFDVLIAHGKPMDGYSILHEIQSRNLLSGEEFSNISVKEVTNPPMDLGPEPGFALTRFGEVYPGHRKNPMLEEEKWQVDSDWAKASNDIAEIPQSFWNIASQKSRKVDYNRFSLNPRNDLIPTFLFLVFRLWGMPSERNSEILSELSIPSLDQVLESKSPKELLQRLTKTLQDDERIYPYLVNNPFDWESFPDESLKVIINRFKTAFDDIAQLTDSEFGRIFSHLLSQRELGNSEPSRHANDYLCHSVWVDELVAELAGDLKGMNVYDPCPGLGGFLGAILRKNGPNDISIFANDQLNSEDHWILTLLAHGKWDYSQTNHLMGKSHEAPQAGSTDWVISTLPMGYNLPIVHKSSNNENETKSYQWKGAEPSSTFSILFNAIDTLKPSGRAILMVPDYILHGMAQDVIASREKLLATGIIEAIISLPLTIYDTCIWGDLTKHPSSLLILDMQKCEKEILMINGDSFFHSIEDCFPTLADTKSLKSLYASKDNDSPHSCLVSKEEIPDDSYRLDPRYYLWLQTGLFHQEQEKGEYLVPLGSMITEPKKDFPRAGEVVYQLSELELAENVVDGFINKEALKRSGQTSSYDKVLAEKVILFQNSGQNQRISLWNGGYLNIAKNITAIIPSSDQIDFEFLAFELDSEFLRQQINYMIYCTEKDEISLNDLKHLKIHLPALPEQKRRVQEQKERYYQQKKYENNLLKARLDVQDAELRVLSALKHDTMGQLEKVSSGMKLIKQFLHSKSQQNQPVSLEEPIILNMEPSPRKLDSLNTVLIRVEGNIKQLIGTLEANFKDLESTHRELEKVPIALQAFLKEEVLPEYQNETSYKISIRNDESSALEAPISISADKAYLLVIFQNLIINATRHGFTEKNREPYQIQFTLSRKRIDEKEYALISYQNDGKPFPDGFTFEKFITRGKKAGETGNLGLGGSRIWGLVDRHNGYFREVPAAPDKNSFNINFEILLPIDQHKK